MVESPTYIVTYLVDGEPVLRSYDNVEDAEADAFDVASSHRDVKVFRLLGDDKALHWSNCGP